jgi:hypothetical protein
MPKIYKIVDSYSKFTIQSIIQNFLSYCVRVFGVLAPHINTISGADKLTPNLPESDA